MSRRCRPTSVASDRAASVAWSARIRVGAVKALASSPQFVWWRRNAKARRHSRRADVRGVDLLRGRSRLSRAGAAGARPFRSRHFVAQSANRSFRRSCAGAGAMVAVAARSTSLMRWSIERSPRVRRSKSRWTACSRRARRRPSSSAARFPTAELTAGGGWGTGSDLARGRASQSLVSAETRYRRRASRQSGRLRCELGSSTFSANTAARSRRRNTTSMLQSPPTTSCWSR